MHYSKYKSHYTLTRPYLTPFQEAYLSNKKNHFAHFGGKFLLASPASETNYNKFE